MAVQSVTTVPDVVRVVMGLAGSRIVAMRRDRRSGSPNDVVDMAELRREAEQQDQRSRRQ